MEVTSVTRLAKMSQGKKKDGSLYILLRVHDEANFEYVNFFGDEAIIKKVDSLGIQKGDEVKLILDISPSFKGFYVSLVDIELADIEL